MPKVRPLEVKALRPLLQQDWDSEDELIEALILALDEARASRKSYVGVMQFGRIVFGIGPYPGRRGAENALVKHPGLSLANAATVAEIMTPKGFEQFLKELDAPLRKAG